MQERPRGTLFPFRDSAIGRAALVAGGLLGVWQAVVWLTGVEPFILPGPARVAAAWVRQADVILVHTATTALEIGLGLLLGTLAGALSALALAHAPALRRWLMPLLVASQALPVFALAPLLVLWLGYGLASKVAMATLIIYFPVAIAFLDGLRRTDPAMLDAALTLGCGPVSMLLRVRLPAALPALGSGLRVAAGVAPIGAVVGEWVGSSAGLGYLMLHANARLQVDVMFAALLTLAALGILLYRLVDLAIRRALPWQVEDEPADA